MRRLNARILSTASFAALVVAGFPGAAYASSAQDEQAPACDTLPAGAERDACLAGEVELESGETAQTQTGEQNIEVTGSRIRRPNLESNVPITSVGQEELLNQGDVNVGDRLNDLPSLRSTFSQSNSTRFIGTAGLNLLDLRGLGTERTLVLVNGRRHITATPGDFDIDVNTIPTDLIERVDIVTGGSSAVYGSDAIAGVVNFVLRRDFDGIQARGQAGVSQRGDRGIQFAALTAGRNFAADRGNIAISLEYVNAEPYYFTQREDFTGNRIGNLDASCAYQVDEPIAGEPGGSDGIPDNQIQCGLRSTSISLGGILNANASATPTLANGQPNPLFCGNLPAAIRAQRCTAQNQPRIFDFIVGGITESVLVRDLRPFGNAFSVGGRGATVSEAGQFAPGLDRYSANLLAHFDVSEAFRPFVEAKYVHLRALQQGQPTFFQGGLLGTFSCSNPFLSQEQINGLVAIGRCTTTATSGIYNPNGTFAISRFNTDFGPRGEINERDTYRIVAGFEGDFNDDWHYEVSYNYGRLETSLASLNNLILTDINGNFDGYLLAYDAVRNAAGQIVCRVNADASTANDRPDCVPLNVFGTGAPSQAALDFVNTTSFAEGLATQHNAVAFLNGDSSQLISLPGGPIRFVVGAEWRRETAFQDYDDLTQADATFFNAFQTFDPPPFEVYEFFGELELPILRDLPFAQELTVTGAARYSDYNTRANKTFAWNVNGTWAPVRDIRFRANYSESVRVPTLGDLFSPLGQTFALVQDPCDINFINNGPNRAANCAALGVPAGHINELARTETAGYLVGGNELLQEETGRSLTIGAVIQPRWVPGLSVTVDYFDIEVEDLIAVLGPQQILNLCVDQATIDNQYCELINGRKTVDDPATAENEIGDFLDFDNILTSGGVNFARQTSRGIDVDVSYRRTLGNGHRLNLRAVATYLLERTNFTDPTDPTFGNRIRSELGDPAFAASASVNYAFNNIELDYTVNYIGRMTIGLYEAQNSFQGRPPTNADQFPVIWHPDVFYHAARITYRVDNRFRFYFGVDNIGDRKPPNYSFATGAGSAIWDNVGRYFYGGFRVDY